MNNYFQENNDYFKQNDESTRDKKVNSLKDDLDKFTKDVNETENYSQINAYSKKIGYVKK